MKPNLRTFKIFITENKKHIEEDNHFCNVCNIRCLEMYKRLLISKLLKDLMANLNLKGTHKS